MSTTGANLLRAPVQVGEVLDGKYSVERVLGVGGMGVVVAARHVQLEQLVAIKFLLPEAVAQKDLIERFAREARAAAKIQSEHVARVIDVATLPTGAPYMVMEYLDGGDLSEVLTANGALSIVDAVQYVLQACEAIAEAHAAGIVHRDLKPANLFLARRADGTSIVKVLDFGISKLSGAMAMTKTVAVMGSPFYMSPEQLESVRDVDGRSDIWSLGIILHELLSGKVPYDAETMPQLCMMILTQAPPPLRAVRPDAPPELEAVIQRCLQRDPNHRFADVAEFAEALWMFGSPTARESAKKIGRVLSSARMKVAGSTQTQQFSTLPLSTTRPPEIPASVSSPAMSRMSGGSGVSGASGVGWGPPGATTGAPSKVTTFGASTAIPPRKGTNLVPVIVAVAGLLLATAAVVGIASYRRAKSTATAGLTGVTTGGQASAAAPMMNLTIVARPAQAKIFIDDAEAGTNPYIAKVKMDGASHRLRVEAPGHETQQKLALFDRDLSFDIELAVDKATDRPKETPGKSSPHGGPTPSGKPGKKMYDNPW